MELNGTWNGIWNVLNIPSITYYVVQVYAPSQYRALLKMYFLMFT